MAVKTISEVVQILIQAHKEGRSVNLSTIKSQCSRRNGLSSIPKTVEIIAAIPENWKKFILPKIRAKPVRTASGVRSNLSIKQTSSNKHQTCGVSSWNRWMDVSSGPF